MPSYPVGVVPTQKEHLNWRVEITSEREYNICVGSGLGFVLFPDLPLSWKACLKELEEGND